MSFFHRLKLRFSPPRLEDPELGRLVFMYIPAHPERSYWEGDWLFPPTATRVALALPGTDAGPHPQGREFCLRLPARFGEILQRVRPRLRVVFRTWLAADLPDDLWSALTLAGFAVEDPRKTPLEWDVAFETTGATWLGISVPFVGDEPGEAVVDT
jgi:hypothetical protein